MSRAVILETDQIDRLLELIFEYRDAVASGEISGFHQSKEDELTDADMIASALRAAR
jgi:hypothetical protein